MQEIIPKIKENRKKLAKKLLFSEVQTQEELQVIRGGLQTEQTYLNIVKQFTQLYGEADFAIMVLHAALDTKGFNDSVNLRKELIALSLYSILQYDENNIDIDYYGDFRNKSMLEQVSRIVTSSTNNISLILSSETIQLFEKYGNKKDQFLKILVRFIAKPECTPRIFHEIFKAIQKVIRQGEGEDEGFFYDFHRHILT